MGFFKSVKDKLGIGGVKMELQIPEEVAKDSGIIEGKIILTTKSVQDILRIDIFLKEDFTSGRGDSEDEATFDLGELKIHKQFKISPGETKEIEFKLPFDAPKTDADEFAEKGGALGVLGKLGKIARNEKSSYYVSALVDVKTAALDPSEDKEIKLV